MKPTMRNFLIRMQWFDEISEYQIASILLGQMKSARKGKSNEEIISKGFNIYKERTETFESLLDEAIHENYIEVTEITEDGRKLHLTDDGLLALTICLTDHFPSYKAFEEEFRDHLRRLGQVAPTTLSIMLSFHSGKSAVNAAAQYSKPSTAERFSRGYHQHVMKEYGGIEDISEDDYVFHLMPKLYLPDDLIGKKVALQIEGLPVPPLVLTSPYPNKHYVVAGMKKGRSRSAYGCYPLVAPRERFPAGASLLLRWTVDGEIKFDHRINLTFDFGNSFGQFFSTQMHFNRDVSMKKFSIITTIKPSILSKRKAKVIVRDIYNHFEIVEQATLTNFPMELHSGQSGNHYAKWYQEQTQAMKKIND